MPFTGSQNIPLTITVDVDAFWAVEYMAGRIKLPPMEARIADWKQWADR